MATQLMVIAGYTLVTNPDVDSDWHYAIEQAKFLPVDSAQDITQILGVHSGERDFAGYFQSDDAYATLEASYRLTLPVAVVDWKGNSYTALLLDLVPHMIMDIITGFQTRGYKLTMRRING